MNEEKFLIPADRFFSCQHCRITFVWTGWEQLHEVQAPAYCPGCRRLLEIAPRWGVVKWFDVRKGFGFITMSDGSDIYVRRRDVQHGRSLRSGQWVSFVVKEGKNKRRATRVRIRRST